MFTVYDASNYKSSEGLLVWYDQDLIDDECSIIKLTRHATKSYSFLDMDSTTASACAAAKTTQYTHNFDRWEYDDSEEDPEDRITEQTYTECPGDIEITKNPCGSFDVNISVSETDIKYIIYTHGETISNPATYFTAANARNYDEDVHPKTTEGLSTYNEQNLNVKNGLSIRYTTEKLENDYGYKYTRYATKTMTYFGMNQATAEACATAKRAQYNRLYFFIDGGDQKMRVASGATIALRHINQTWAVDININETDTRALLTLRRDLSVVFAYENARSYN